MRTSLASTQPASNSKEDMYTQRVFADHTSPMPAMSSINCGGTPRIRDAAVIIATMPSLSFSKLAVTDSVSSGLPGTNSSRNSNIPKITAIL